jgi:hypothetical protein
MKTKTNNFVYSRPLWLGATLFSLLCYAFAFHFFPKAFPIIHLDITMDREQALEKADSIAQAHHYGPEDHQNAVAFHTDSTVQTFIELEAGGKDAFINMMENKLYIPYTWNVRHFKEFNKNETTIKFTPDGKPYSFIETISENDAGAQLTEKAARALAENEAQEHWSINFTPYKLVEASQKTQPSNRIDHTFVYERIDETIGEGFYRLKIQVSGDKVTEITHSVKVPETFVRRYAEMRSANNTIAWAATILMALLYIIGGCGVGLYFITKRRYDFWKQASLWGAFIAIAMTCAGINQLPLVWMHYNSALSSNGFLLQTLLGVFIGLITQTLLLTIIIAVSESLTRRAFGNHPQLWSLWLPHNRATYAVLGRTIGAYLLVGFSCAFVIGFYLITTRYFNWWTPSEMLFNPNILATYLPWLSPLAMSLQAGFMEECLFRAIPLAGAALLGEHFGKKNLWIGAAFILQALIFGAAHANYPTQPAYGRLIELLIPSFIWGALYLRFGLLSTIITHVVYDIIWFSIPIFISSAPHALLYKIIIIVCSLLPLLIVAYGRIQQGRWTDLHDNQTNAAWQPETMIENVSSFAEASSDTTMDEYHNVIIPKKHQTGIIILGIISIIAWLYTTPFSHDGVRITTTQHEAITQARSFLQMKNIQLDRQWRTLPLFFAHYSHVPTLNMQHKFIWQEGKKEVYHQLLNTHLQPAHWTIRHAQFDGDIIERAEEHTVLEYDAIRYWHKLPESAVGAHLTKKQARPLAHKALQEIYHLDPAQLTEISAQETQRPHRKDWLFTFSDQNAYKLTTGQARITIALAGDEVIDTARIIHVPESWERNEHNNILKLRLINLIVSLMFMFMFIASSWRAYKNNARSHFSKTLFGYLWLFFTTLVIIDAANSWPSVIGVCNTMEPLNNQLLQKIISSLLMALMRSTFFAFIIARIIGTKSNRCIPKTWSALSMGIALGLCYAAVTNMNAYCLPMMQPLWPNYTPLGSSLPVVAALIQAIFSYTGTTIFACLIGIIINSATNYWQKNTLFFGLFFVVLGLMLTTLPAFSSLPLWLTCGIIKGIVLLLLYRYIIRYDSSLIPLATGSFVITKIIRQGIFNAYPGAALAAIISACIVVAMSYIWFKQMNKE